MQSRGVSSIPTPLKAGQANPMRSRAPSERNETVIVMETNELSTFKPTRTKQGQGHNSVPSRTAPNPTQSLIPPAFPSSRSEVGTVASHSSAPSTTSTSSKENSLSAGRQFRGLFSYFSRSPSLQSREDCESLKEPDDLDTKIHSNISPNTQATASVLSCPLQNVENMDTLPMKIPMLYLGNRQCENSSGSKTIRPHIKNLLQESQKSKPSSISLLFSIHGIKMEYTSIKTDSRSSPTTIFPLHQLTYGLHDPIQTTVFCFIQKCKNNSGNTTTVPLSASSSSQTQTDLQNICHAFICSNPVIAEKAMQAFQLMFRRIPPVSEKKLSEKVLLLVNSDSPSIPDSTI